RCPAAGSGWSRSGWPSGPAGRTSAVNAPPRATTLLRPPPRPRPRSAARRAGGGPEAPRLSRGARAEPSGAGSRWRRPRGRRRCRPRTRAGAQRGAPSPAPTARRRAARKRTHAPAGNRMAAQASAWLPSVSSDDGATRELARLPQPVEDDLGHRLRQVGDKERSLPARQARPERGAEDLRAAAARLEVGEVAPDDRVVEVGRVGRVGARVIDEGERIAGEDARVLGALGRAVGPGDGRRRMLAVCRHGDDLGAMTATAAAGQEPRGQGENPYGFHTPDHLSGWRAIARFRRRL